MRHLLAFAAAASLSCSGAPPRPSLPPRPDDRGRVVAPCSPSPPRGGLRVSGHIFAFGPGGNDGRLAGAVVRSLEHPQRCAVSAGDGAFALDGFVAGEDATLTLDHLGFAPIQTGTHAVPAGGIERLTFQAPVWEIFHIMAMTSLIRPREGRCQIASTVTERGVSIYDPPPSHGEAGATVTLEPHPDDITGPVYFQYVGPGVILPDPHLRETTRDGGVLFLNLPPGDYVLTARKDGARIRQVRARCRAGWLVNASPPWGLQVE